MRYPTLAMAAALWIIALPAAAQPVELLRIDTKELPVVYVKDMAGRETAGRLLGITSKEVALLVDGSRREIPLAEVMTIDRRGDSVKNGAYIGGAIGAVWLLAALKATSTGTGHFTTDAMVVAVGSATAGGTGALIDWLYRGRTRVYTAPSGPSRRVTLSPFWRPAQKGVAVRMEF